VSLFMAVLAWPAESVALPSVLVNPRVRGNGTARTIQEGIDAVDPGGKVLVLPGTYEESLVIAKGLTLEGIGGASGAVVVVVSSPPPSSIAVTVATTDPVVIRDLTLMHRGSNGIRGVGPVDLTVERVSIFGQDAPLGLGRVISVFNDAPNTSRARLVVRESFLDGGISFKNAVVPAYPQVFGISLGGDVDALIERNVVRRVGGACVAVFVRNDLGGETNADIFGNDLDECYPLGRVGAVFTGPAGTSVPTPDRRLTAIGVVNVVGNTIRNSTGSCVPASAILFETFGGRIEDNRVSGFVQSCPPDGPTSARGGPSAIGVGSVRPLFPAVNVAVRFNDIDGNAHAGLRIAPNETSSLEARCNWWGAADGPSGAGVGSGDALVVQPGAATPVFSPWSREPIAGTGASTCAE
jgi:hypothetical protein